MPIRAEHDPKFYRRFLYMGVIACLVALWFLYDGAVGYPAQRERAIAFKQIHESLGSDPIAFKEKWQETAQQHNWPVSYPGEPRENGEIIMQFVMAGMAALAGLYMISLPLRARGRWIEADDSGVRSSWGQNYTYDQIVALNKRQWRRKGIARIAYHDGSRTRRFVLDDYKFDRHATDAILFEIEQRVDPGLIIGGPPEQSPEYRDEITAEPPPGKPG